MASKWEYDVASHRYRDVDSGRFLSQATMAALRDDFIAAQKDRVRELATQVGDATIGASEWTTEMRQVVKDVHGAEYAFGRGGLHAMESRDWGIIGHTVRDEYGHLQDFAREVEQGGLSTAQINARGALYTEAGSATMERGRTEARGMPRLDQYPGDGGTECQRQCNCSLDIEPVEDGWEITWQIGNSPSGSCADCEALAADWNPLFIEAGPGRGGRGQAPPTSPAPVVVPYVVVEQPTAPPAPERSLVKSVERDADGLIARVIERRVPQQATTVKSVERDADGRVLRVVETQSEEVP